MNTSAIKNTGPLSGEHPHREYVLSTDACAGAGIDGLLNEQGKKSIRLSDDTPFCLQSAFSFSRSWRLTVVIPEDPLVLLKLTRSMANMLRRSVQPPHILILSPVPADWLLRTLEALACPVSILIHITVLPARTDCRSLAALLSRDPLSSGSLKSDRTGETVYPVLTPAEFRAVYDWLSGQTAKTCASACGGSVKTVYLQRYNGRCKLALLFPLLHPQRKLLNSSVFYGCRRADSKEAPVS